MKTRQKQNLLAAALVSALAFTTTQAQQYPNPTTAAEVPGPAPGSAMTTAYVQTVGRMAYLWGWPLVNMANRGIASSKAPEPGLLGGDGSFLKRLHDRRVLGRCVQHTADPFVESLLAR